MPRYKKSSGISGLQPGDTLTLFKPSSDATMNFRTVTQMDEVANHEVRGCSTLFPGAIPFFQILQHLEHCLQHYSKALKEYAERPYTPQGTPYGESYEIIHEGYPVIFISPSTLLTELEAMLFSLHDPDDLSYATSGALNVLHGGLTKISQRRIRLKIALCWPIYEITMHRAATPTRFIYALPELQEMKSVFLRLLGSKVGKCPEALMYLASVYSSEELSRVLSSQQLLTRNNLTSSPFGCCEIMTRTIITLESSVC